MLSVSLSTPTSHHGLLLFAMLLVTLMLAIEARRYRFFDVYRARVRLLERSYFAQVFDPDAAPREDWSKLLAADLRKPLFQIRFRVALSRRLKRNYCWMYLILLLAWILRISSARLQAPGEKLDFLQTFGEILGNASLGPVPGGGVVAMVALFYAVVVIATLRKESPTGELAHGNVHV
jgi:uncharacterized membrane protein